MGKELIHGSAPTRRPCPPLCRSTKAVPGRPGSTRPMLSRRYAALAYASPEVIAWTTPNGSST